jgi:hypothetical protein
MYRHLFLRAELAAAPVSLSLFHLAFAQTNEHGRDCSHELNQRFGAYVPHQEMWSLQAIEERKCSVSSSCEHDVTADWIYQWLAFRIMDWAKQVFDFKM